MNNRKYAAKALLNIAVFIVVLVEIYPLVLMVFGSFKTAAELSGNPSGIPMEPTLDNYARLFSYSGGLIVRCLSNSIFIAVVCTGLTLLISAMAAYAFAKCPFRGKKTLFMMLLVTMMVPVELTIPPLYIVFSKIGWLNSYSVQIFPFVANVFALFMIRQFMMSIPDALVEAAKIDGASHTRIFFSIMLPVSAPVLSALGILVFLNRWNEFLWPTIMISKSKFAPIMQVLPTLNDTGVSMNVPWELMLTGCSIVTIPVVIVFYVFQDKFLSSATLGAVKG